LELWEAAGIERVTALPMSLGGGVVIWGERAPHAEDSRAGVGDAVETTAPQAAAEG
jgi:hypothetical protein